MMKIVQIFTLQKFQFVIILVNPINVWTSLNTVLIEVFSLTSYSILIVHLADFLTCNQTSLFITLCWIYITIIILIIFQQIKIIFVFKSMKTIDYKPNDSSVMLCVDSALINLLFLKFVILPPYIYRFCLLEI